jgi:lauroyl/myristoyl acyltransferase
MRSGDPYMDDRDALVAPVGRVESPHRHSTRRSWLSAFSRAKLQATRDTLARTGLGHGAQVDALAMAAVAFGFAYHLRLAFLWARPLRQRWQRNVECAPETRMTFETWCSRQAGVVLVVPHLGDFDIAGSWLVESVGADVTVVVDRISRRIDQRLYNVGRRQAQLRIRDAREIRLGDLREDLEAGRFVILMLDRRARGSSVEVSLLGHSARISVAPAVLCAQTEAELAVAATISRKRRREIHLTTVPTRSAAGEARAAVDICADLAAEMELLIRLAPTQWLVSSDVSQLVIAGGGPVTT